MVKATKDKTPRRQLPPLPPHTLKDRTTVEVDKLASRHAPMLEVRTMFSAIVEAVQKKQSVLLALAGPTHFPSAYEIFSACPTFDGTDDGTNGAAADPPTLDVEGAPAPAQLAFEGTLAAPMVVFTAADGVDSTKSPSVTKDEAPLLPLPEIKPEPEPEPGMTVSETLNWAAGRGYIGTVQKLLGSNADPNEGRAKDGATPMYVAAAKGHVDVVTTLLNHRNADPNQATTTKGLTPLYVAAHNNHAEVVAALVEHSAGPSSVDPNKASTGNGSTPLYVAADKGHSESVAKLLQHSNIDVNQATTNKGFTPMYVAANRGHLNIVAMLLEHGTAPNCADPNKASTGNRSTPLAIATQKGYATIVAKLLEHRADPNIGTSNGAHAGTPLKTATTQGHTAIAKMLRAAGALGEI